MKILIASSSRADYDLLYPIILELKRSKKIKYIFLITGSHSRKEFLEKKKELDKKKIKTKFLDILKNTSRNSELIFSNSIKKFSAYLKKNKPDLLIILGDRFEILSLAVSAVFKKIPIAHISGGELTEASMDDSIRHSLTKFAHFHFVANDVYKRRVIQLGENPKNVFITGGTGIDNIKNINFYSKEELEKLLSFKFKKFNFIVTYLPVTYLDKKKTHKDEIKNILLALLTFKESNIFVTYPNIDDGSNDIIKEIREMKKKNKNIKIFVNLGKKFYLSILKKFDCVVGNSSSGITEAPTIGIPTINIGNRQKGRLKSQSIIDCKANKFRIIQKLKKVLSKKFRSKIQNQKTFYGNGNASKKIVKIIEKINLNNSLNKKFYDF